MDCIGQFLLKPCNSKIFKKSFKKKRRENDSRLYSIKSIGKGYFSNQTMTSSFSFAALAKANVTWLHCKGILWKEIKEKLSLIKLMSSMI